jgi:4-hydroxy-2-oxoheptanedioate aldolase
MKNEDHGRYGFWLSSCNVAAAEIAALIGYRSVVLDIEHGSFDLEGLDRFIPLLKGLGHEVIAKVLAAERGPIQEALDFGADAVVIPHILGAKHAKQICGFAKFPPLGDRSFAGGRTVAFGAADDAWVKEQDRKTKCYPMVEDAGAIEEIEGILALDCVDGVYVGPSDLSLRRGRGAYKRSDKDFADLKHVADAAAAAGKRWLLPAWSVEEKKFALANNAYHLTLTMEHGALAAGLREAWTLTEKLSSEMAAVAR